MIIHVIKIYNKKIYIKDLLLSTVGDTLTLAIWLELSVCAVVLFL